VFRGISLAGRSAGFYSSGTERATARLRKALKDTEIRMSEDDPVFGEAKQTSSADEVARWARSLVARLQEHQNARS
jgi:hypothetical protein